MLWAAEKVNAFIKIKEALSYGNIVKEVKIKYVAEKAA